MFCNHPGKTKQSVMQVLKKVDGIIANEHFRNNRTTMENCKLKYRSLCPSDAAALEGTTCCSCHVLFESA